MSRIRHFAATLALAAMTLSLAEGLLASSCAEDASSGEMSMMHEGEAAPRGTSGSTAPDGDRPQSDCPMSAAALVSCAASSAMIARATVGVLAVAVTAERVPIDAPHIPGSFHALGLFRPPIA